MDYMHHQRCEIDRRSVRVRLTEKGRAVRDVVARLFEGHATGLQAKRVIDMNSLDEIAAALRRVERYWTDQIRYIY
jgi:DNA-binding MarR family transcriptional regulator